MRPVSVSPALGSVHEVDAGGARLRYREAGSGPPLVFVHGLLVNGDLWRGVVERLSDRYRCIAPDWPLGSHEIPLPAAFDRSPAGVAALVASTLEALELEDVTLVGNDTGGAITQLAMVHHPERLARAVLTPCDAFDNFLPRVFKPLQLLGRWRGSYPVLGALLRARSMQRLPIAFGWLTKRPVPAEIMASYLGPLRRDPAIRRDVSAFMRNVGPKVTTAVAARLPEFTKPVLVAWDDRDRVFPRAHAERLAQVLPDARLRFIEDSYAFVPEDRPDALAEAIAEFVEAT